MIEDSQTAEQALQSGDIDIFSTSAAHVISDFRDDADDFPMTEQNQYDETNYILIDLDQAGPLQDARVRCALSMAIDRQELIDLTAGGILQVANGLFSPGQEGYLEDNGFNTAQDIDGAKALIDDYKARPARRRSTSPRHARPTAINDQAAELLKGYWDADRRRTPRSTGRRRTSSSPTPCSAIPTFQIYGWRNHAGLDRRQPELLVELRVGAARRRSCR